MNNLSTTLGLFSSTTLGSLGKAGLLSRQETKFIFPQEMLPAILDSVRAEYEILEINGNRVMNYETLYFDTPDLFHFRQHITRRRSRYKVRFRKYIDTDCVYFEIKSKNNHNRTVKKRMQVPSVTERIDTKERLFLEEHSPLGNEILEKKLNVYYTRITLVNRLKSERVTIDLNLSFSHNDMQKSFPGLAIAEVKQDSHLPSTFTAMMRKQRIRQFSISKYCLGIISFDGRVRHNLYKPKIRYLNHFIYASQRNP